MKFTNKNNSIIEKICWLFINLLPLYGVWTQGWTFFLVMYIFWFEMLIVTFFNTFKILLSQGHTLQEGVLRGEAVALTSRFGEGLKYLIVRMMIFLFYMIFIIVFVGLGVGTHSSIKDASVRDMATALYFSNGTFNLAIISFFSMNLYQFLKKFVLNQRFLVSQPEEFSAYFDYRMITVHVTLVLGVFLGKFLVARFGSQSPLVMPLVVTFFVIVKIVFENIAQYLASDK
jgi:hypothetical protein